MLHLPCENFEAGYRSLFEAIYKAGNQRISSQKHPKSAKNNNQTQRSIYGNLP